MIALGVTTRNFAVKWRGLPITEKSLLEVIEMLCDPVHVRLSCIYRRSSPPTPAVCSVSNTREHCVYRSLPHLRSLQQIMVFLRVFGVFGVFWRFFAWIRRFYGFSWEKISWKASPSILFAACFFTVSIYVSAGISNLSTCIFADKYRCS